MLKKTIEYEDFNGNLVKEDKYFNLTDAELMELELSYKGGLSKYLQELLENEDTLGIMNFIKKLVFISYGKRSEDGKRFIKDEKFTQEFFQTDAYSKLLMDLLTDQYAGAKFINGLVSNSRKMSDEELMKVLEENVKALEAKNENNSEEIAIENNSEEETVKSISEEVAVDNKEE